MTEEQIVDIGIKTMIEIDRISQIGEYEFDHSSQRRAMQIDAIANVVKKIRNDTVREIVKILLPYDDVNIIDGVMKLKLEQIVALKI